MQKDELHVIQEPVSLMDIL